MQLIDLRQRPLDTPERVRAVLPRASASASEDAARAARDLVDDVRHRGLQALREQAEAFDGGASEHVRVPPEHFERALAELDPAVREALTEMIRRVRLASQAQVPEPQTTRLGEGALVHQRFTPVERAGLYVPGGKAVYPSSVVMSVVPAQAAGVAGIAVASPPQRDHAGRVHPTILAACALLGVSEVYAMGGAGAIGALAYGVPEIGLDPVSVVTGPGNSFVAAAKRAVAGVVGIDSEAGPTEIMVLADESASPMLVAADLLSQSEHDEEAASVLVTDSEPFARAVLVELERQLASTPHRERAAASLGGVQSAVLIVRDEHEATAIANAYGAEHLELMTRDPRATLGRITNAGAIFLGAHSPVSLGDYLAGSNHVLPTMGRSAFSSGLGAHTFLRPQQVIEYTETALDEVIDRLVAIARAEALPAHADAALSRRGRYS